MRFLRLHCINFVTIAKLYHCTATYYTAICQVFTYLFYANYINLVTIIHNIFTRSLYLILSSLHHCIDKLCMVGIYALILSQLHQFYHCCIAAWLYVRYSRAYFMPIILILSLLYVRCSYAHFVKSYYQCIAASLSTIHQIFTCSLCSHYINLVTAVLFHCYIGVLLHRYTSNIYTPILCQLHQFYYRCISGAHASTLYNPITPILLHF